MPPNLQGSVRDLLEKYVRNQTNEEGGEGGEYTPVDVCRILRDEAALLYQTQCVRDMITSDPFQNLDNKDDPTIRSQILKFLDSIRVVQFKRTETHFNYSRIEAVVEWFYNDENKNHKSAKSPSKIQLSFLFEVRPSRCNQDRNSHHGSDQQQQQQGEQLKIQTTPTIVWYSIELSCDHGRKEQLLAVQVWADGDGPSSLPAIPFVMMEEEEEDDWEDMEEEENNEEEASEKMDRDQKRKRKRKEQSGNGGEQKNNKKNDNKPSPRVAVNNKDNEKNRKEKASDEDSDGSWDTVDDDDKNDDDDDNNDGGCGNNMSMSPKDISKAEDKDNKEHASSNGDHDMDEVDSDTEEKDNIGDRYSAFLDPDLLAGFVRYARLSPSTDQATAFFLLMTFPFYEQEWDLAGFVLDTFFGYGSDDDDDAERDD